MNCFNNNVPNLTASERTRNVKVRSIYKSTRRDFEESMAGFNGAYEKYLRMLVDKRGGMMMLTSKDEWALIMDRESTFIPE